MWRSAYIDFRIHKLRKSSKTFVKTIGGPTWVQAACFPNKIIAEHCLHATLLQLEVYSAQNQAFVSGSPVQCHMDTYEVRTFIILNTSISDYLGRKVTPYLIHHDKCRCDSDRDIIPTELDFITIMHYFGDGVWTYHNYGFNTAPVTAHACRWLVPSHHFCSTECISYYSVCVYVCGFRQVWKAQNYPEECYY
jgi:hypothetical protein